MSATPELIKAFNHVKSIFPSVTMVIFNNQGQWHYCDKYFNFPNFDERIDVGLLEDAADSIQVLPYVYELPYDEDEN